MPDTMKRVEAPELLACPNDSLFDAAAFGQSIRAKLKTDRMSFREAAPVVPCSVASLNRAARGLAPDVENYLRISRWLTGARTPDQIAGLVSALEESQRYSAGLLSDLADAKRETSLLRDAVVTYGDRLRMATVPNMAMQQAIDRAFDRDN